MKKFIKNFFPEIIVFVSVVIVITILIKCPSLADELTKYEYGTVAPTKLHSDYNINFTVDTVMNPDSIKLDTIPDSVTFTEDSLNMVTGDDKY